MPGRIALYPGTFDCLTYGHLDVIQRCSRLFDRLLVAVALNPSKVPLFSVEERLEMLREATLDLHNIEIVYFGGLTVQYAHDHGIHCIIRGLRAVSDFESELQLALMNQRVDPAVETIFMTPSLNHVFISSSLTKEIITHDGDVSSLVPPHVERELRKRLGLLPKTD